MTPIGEPFDPPELAGAGHPGRRTATGRDR